MKDGDDGSDANVLFKDIGWIERPFMLRGFRGDGDVTGRSIVLMLVKGGGASDGGTAAMLPFSEENAALE